MGFSWWRFVVPRLQAKLGIHPFIVCSMMRDAAPIMGQLRSLSVQYDKGAMTRGQAWKALMSGSPADGRIDLVSSHLSVGLLDTGELSSPAETWCRRKWIRLSNSRRRSG